MTTIIPGTTAITANGTYAIRPDQASPFLQIKGVLGGAKITLGHVDGDGDFSRFLNDQGAATVISQQGTLQVPTGYQLAISVADATGTTDFQINLLANR